MELANHISDLLYRYDCVIVPGFGGFITNSIGAKQNPFTHTFYPPSKQISFNVHLKHNDGLLINYIARCDKISFEQASQKVVATIAVWQNTLASKPLNFPLIGSLFLNKEKQLVFNPFTVNYLMESFGLSAVNSPDIKRLINKENTLISVGGSQNKQSARALKYVATIAVLMTLSVTYWSKIDKSAIITIPINRETVVEGKISTDNSPNPATKKIQESGFSINNSLINGSLIDKKLVIKKSYYIIAGAFRIEKNAERQMNQLRKKGFDSKNIGKNEWGLTRITFGKFDTPKEALQQLRKIRKAISKQAWLLVEQTPK